MCSGAAQNYWSYTYRVCTFFYFIIVLFMQFPALYIGSDHYSSQPFNNVFQELLKIIWAYTYRVCRFFLLHYCAVHALCIGSDHYSSQPFNYLTALTNSDVPFSEVSLFQRALVRVLPLYSTLQWKPSNVDTLGTW